MLKSGDEELVVFEPSASNTLDNDANDLIPMFSSKGKFINHESKGNSNQDNQPLAPSGPSRSAGDYAHPGKHNRWYAFMFTLLLSFVIVVSALFFSGRKKRDTSIPEELASSKFGVGEIVAMAAPSLAPIIPKPTNAVGDITSTLGQHARAESPAPTNQHTHTYHPTRHTGSPTERPTHKQHTHPVPHRASSIPTGKPTHKKHNHADRKPTGRPTHKRHDHAHRLSSTPTEKPTHKRHDHGDRKPTGRPTHKRHDHSDRQSSAPTEKPTHKRHDHGGRKPTGRPTHKRHDHSNHTPSKLNESLSASPSARINISPVSASTSEPLIHIKPNALATIAKSNPEFKGAGMEHLSVQHDERISFLQFDLSTISSDTLTKATLKLHLTAHDNAMGAITVNIDLLPHVQNWSTGSVSWKESLLSEEPFFVDDLVALPLASEVAEQLYRVDVTSALLSPRQWVTFRLSTESSGRLSFASEEWNGGEFTPELVITL